MKTVNNLFDKICTKENILLAIRKAARGKRKKRVVQQVLANEEVVADKLLEQLQSGTWKPNAIHNVKVINDGIPAEKARDSLSRFCKRADYTSRDIEYLRTYFSKKIL